MYHEKLVVALRANGHFLKEKGDTVFIPFGSEYSIRVKNLNSLPARIKITIDGDDVLGGKELALGPKEEIDLERFFGDGPNAAKKFKFVRLTDEVKDIRGERIDDGIIRVSYSFAKSPADLMTWPYYVIWYPYYVIWYPYRTYAYCYPYDPTMLYQAHTVAPRYSSAYSSAACVEPTTDNGITIGGSPSTQKLPQTSTGAESQDTEYVIILRLSGTIGNEGVSEPVTKHTKTKCKTCCTKAEFADKFCRECGTALH